MAKIETPVQLRGLYTEPKGRTLKKVLPTLDKHCRQFISLSRFLVMSTVGRGGALDASPRGGAAGFAIVPDDGTLLIPDWTGNNRLDSFQNIIETGRIGILFLIAGVDETLRVNGVAELRDDLSLRELCKEKNRTPKMVIKIAVEEAFLHCAKAMMRSELWAISAQVSRDSLPTMARMIADQISDSSSLETQEAMVERYKKQLY